VIGRNQERTAQLARAVAGEPRNWQELEAAIVQADVVVTSTSATGHVVELDSVQRARKSRRGRSMFFIDLAVPRDVDPRVEHLDGVFLYNIDDFERVVAESLSSRKREAERGERIVLGDVEGWERWAEAAQATPAIVALRARFRRVLHGELERSLRGRPKHLGAEERQALETMLEAALKKMLHAATVRLRGAALSDDDGADASEAGGERLEQLTMALNELFGLDGGLEADLEAALDAEPEPELDAEAHPLSSPSTPDIARKGRQAS
jgi:glutamyl-tRNA reductase